MTPQERLVATAAAQAGYLGKKSNGQLDSFTANSGGKFTKYARDLDALGDFYNGPKQGFDWCDVFVDWCFVQTFGRALAQKLTCQPDRSAGAGTGYSLGYYKAKGRLFSTPQVGDQIFFGDAKSTRHTGIVTAVSGGMVSTVEGNTGLPLGVHTFRYPLGSGSIKGYGRPDWSLAASEPEENGSNNEKTNSEEAGTSESGTEGAVYRTLDDVPAWARSAVQKCVDQGALQGDGGGLNLSRDLCRVLVVLDRLGKLS